MGRGTLPVALAAALTVRSGGRPRAQTDSVPAGAQPAFHFSSEAGLGLRALWEQSVAAKQERVACLGATIRNDTVFVDRILALAPEEADSMSISATASVERCGPPEWQGTVAHPRGALHAIAAVQAVLRPGPGRDAAVVRALERGRRVLPGLQRARRPLRGRRRGGRPSIPPRYVH